GALPATLTAPPSVTTKLCAPAAAGDEVLRVEKLGGLAIGDTITIGTAPTAEKVVVTGLGDRTAACGDLSVSAVKNVHLLAESVVNIARSSRLKTLVAQCVSTCSIATTGSIALVPDSVVDVTAQVSGGALDYTFPAGNGNAWVVLDLKQTASGLIAQSGGYTVTQPNYVVDHWSRGGARIQNNFWDESILTDAVQANLDKIGSGAVFEDSLELGSTQKWTWGLLNDFAAMRGYDPTLLLPALLGSGLQGTGTPAFELAGVGPKVREDYRATMSDLYAGRYVRTMQRWAGSHGLDFRAQAYGTPIHSGVAATETGIPEGESLNFGASKNNLGAEQNYRVVAGGAHVAGRNIVSVECCAIFQGGYRSSLAGPSVPGQFGQGGDGTATGGRYSQGLLDSVYKSYAGGVNQVVWHGYPYRDAPAGVGSSGRDGGTWPGYHPWDIFGVISVNDEFGPRQASWPDYAKVNDTLARTQLVLQQGRAEVDLGVYYAEYGLFGDSVGAQGPVQHLLGTQSATSKAGYTYDYVAPDFLRGVDVEADGGLFGDTSDQKALVLNNQTTMSVDDARTLLELAEAGLKLFIVGDAPTATPGAKPGSDALAGVIADLLAQPSVVQVQAETGLPAALASAGVRPAVTPAEPTEALGFVRRQGEGISYEFVYNRSKSAVETDLTVTGPGQPYLLDTSTGTIEPIAQYTSDDNSITVPITVPAHDAVILAIATDAAAPATRLGVHAVATTGGSGAQVISAGGQKLALRATADGSYTTTLSNGLKRTTDVAGIAPDRNLETWTLAAQTWTPGANQYTTTKTDQAPFSITAGDNGRLPSWRDILTPVNLSQASGLGTYSTTVTLPDTWTATDGAYLDLGAVLDSVKVTVNGTEVTVDQADRSRIDLGRTLEPGDNAIVVRVATTMFNAVRSTGDSNYQMPTWQSTGLMGPVVLTPYRDTTLQYTPDPSSTPDPTTSQTPTTPTPTTTAPTVPSVLKSETRTRIKVRPSTVREGKRARVAVRVTSATVVDGKVRLRVDGKVYRMVALSGG
ncbi:MAG TPA: glycosyl hydrolase, partial [Sporichthya sp.]|nr:glycosyl hydrolase [Sporichthya sp.]